MSVATTRTNSVQLFDGTYTFTPAVEMVVRGDEWRWGTPLKAGQCQEAIDGFDGADFTITMPHSGVRRHVNVVITGRKPAWKWGDRWLRCNIVIVGDCEPDTVVKGWIKLD